jgi:hypothetical protein
VDTQPAGNYKHAVINVTSFHFSELFGSVSVLRRFYEQYPATQYEVVAYEKTMKTWLPAAGAGAGALVGVGVYFAGGGTGDSFGETDVMLFAVPSILAGVGALVGYMFSTTYVVTYVERQGVVPNRPTTTLGPQG